MKAAGVQPNVVAYASLARPFAHRGEWQEAGDKETRYGCVPSVRYVTTSQKDVQILALMLGYRGGFLSAESRIILVK